ncbi:MAG: hypothetical protein K2G37_03340, partial [Clostridia bacterium]|nr:hypothetical protein [Clostridia bacterium]
IDNDNYEIPTKGGLGVTYKFTANNGFTDFEWEKDFEVVPAEIDLTWTSVKIKDGNGVEFSLLVLKDYQDLTDSNAVISYLYYETDSKYNLISGATPKTYDQIVVDATNRAYYKAYPVLNSAYANDYKLPFEEGDNGLYSSGFVVGGGSTAASVELNTNVYAYNGYGVTLDLKIEGQASKSDFNFAYYKNGTESILNKLSIAPVDVGTYLVVITAKSSSNVVLSGNAKFTFKIEPAVIEINWNESAKPPVLNLLYGQIKGVEYEIRDGDNNPVASFGTTTPTGTYGIRAKIKTGQEKNFIFDNGKTTTDWVEFNYTQGTTVYDPNSPDNPFYPQTPSEKPDAPSDDTTPPDGSNTPTDPDDPTNPSDGDDKDGDGANETLTKIKEFLQDYWQVIVSGVALILIIAFTAKGLSYASKRSKAKKETKKYTTPAYAIALFTAGEKLWNIDYKIWTILAFTLLGVAVLSFIFMLLEKRGYKKAQEELE